MFPRARICSATASRRRQCGSPPMAAASSNSTRDVVARPWETLNIFCPSDLRLGSNLHSRHLCAATCHDFRCDRHEHAFRTSLDPFDEKPCRVCAKFGPRLIDTCHGGDTEIAKGCIVVTHYCHVAWHMQTQLPGNAQNLESDEIRPTKDRFNVCSLKVRSLNLPVRCRPKTAGQLCAACPPYSPLGKGFLTGTIDDSTRFAGNDLCTTHRRGARRHVGAGAVDCATIWHPHALALPGKYRGA